MFQWEEVDDQTLFDMTVKMYRDPYVADKTYIAPFVNAELDYYAYKYLQTETETYKLIDVNFEKYMEERGDMSRLPSIEIPTVTSETGTIL